MKTETKVLLIERQLLKRLKFMAYILLACGAITLVWDFIVPIENELDQLLLELEESPAPLNTYLVSGSFFVVGVLSFLFYWRKKISLSLQIPPEQ